jgi:coatomer protein complex subunit alpha (xenin)
MCVFLLSPIEEAEISSVWTDPLAYLTAKTNVFEDLAAEILETAGLTEADVEDVPIFAASTLKPPPIITPTSEFLWPTISIGESFFDRALASGQLEGGSSPLHVNGDAGPGAAHSALDAWAKEEEVQEDIDPEEGGWELDADGGEFQSAVDGEDAVEAEGLDEDLGASATPGPSETELWVRNNPLAADHVAAGSFETAMQVCFKPLFRSMCAQIALSQASTSTIRSR